MPKHNPLMAKWPSRVWFRTESGKWASRRPTRQDREDRKDFEHRRPHWFFFHSEET